jgi:hypothetical protein
LFSNIYFYPVVREPKHCDYHYDDMKATHYVYFIGKFNIRWSSQNVTKSKLFVMHWAAKKRAVSFPELCFMYRAAVNLNWEPTVQYHR